MENRKTQKNSLWYFNRSRRDIVVAELDLTLRAGQVVDLYKIKPTLRPEYVRYSERFGVLKKRLDSGDLLKLDGPPPKQQVDMTPLYSEAKTVLTTRVRSVVEVDPADKDFIENLESAFLQDVEEMDDHDIAVLNDKFAEEVDLDGFADPLADEE